jgi:hypothetical protein
MTTTHDYRHLRVCVELDKQSNCFFLVFLAANRPSRKANPPPLLGSPKRGDEFLKKKRAAPPPLTVLSLSSTLQLFLWRDQVRVHCLLMQTMVLLSSPLL